MQKTLFYVIMIVCIACTPASPPAIDGEASICKIADYILPYEQHDTEGVRYEGLAPTSYKGLVLLDYNVGHMSSYNPCVATIGLLVYLPNKDSMIVYREDIFWKTKAKSLSSFLKHNNIVYNKPQLLNNLINEAYRFRPPIFDSLLTHDKAITALHQKYEVFCNNYLFQKTLKYITTSPSNTLFQVYRDDTHSPYIPLIDADTNICSNIIVLKVPQNDIMNFELVKIR